MSFLTVVVVAAVAGAKVPSVTGGADGNSPAAASNSPSRNAELGVTEGTVVPTIAVGIVPAVIGAIVAGGKVPAPATGGDVVPADVAGIITSVVGAVVPGTKVPAAGADVVPVVVPGVVQQMSEKSFQGLKSLLLETLLYLWL